MLKFLDIIDVLFKRIGLRKKSLVERVQYQVSRGYKPSAMAVKVVGKLSPRKFNDMMSIAIKKYNATHKNKIFENNTK